MPAAYYRMICIGKLRIPVQLFTVIQDNSIHFNQLHKETKERIESKKTCPHCDGEVKPKDIIKGYQFIKDHYVIFSEEELQQCKLEKDKTILINQFSELSEINPIYYDTPYYVIPDVGGEKAFELLRISLMESSRVAIAKTILVSNEKLVALMPTQNGILMRTLYYADDIKQAPPYNKPQISSNEISAIGQLIDSMTENFELANYHDEYALQIKAMVDEKIEAQDVVIANEDIPQLPVMDAIRESIIKAKPTGSKPRTVKEKVVGKSKTGLNSAPHRSQK